MILVIGPESSGGQWITSLLKVHPECPRIEHNSYPAGWMPETIMPDYSDAPITDVVLCLRDWNISRMSQEKNGYLADHPTELTDTESIRQALRRETSGRRLHCISYEGLCGPLGEIVLEDLISRLGLDPNLYPWSEFKANDGNKKYLKPSGIEHSITDCLSLPLPS